MKKSFLAIFTFIMILLSTAGCGNKEVEPIAIDPEKHVCVQCNMAVADDQFATQLALENGKVYTFDDIGCMFAFMKENKDEKIAAKFVRDYETLEWIKLEDATYVYDENAYTPMAYNVISFSDEKKAKEYADSAVNAKVMSGTEIYDHNWGMNTDMTTDEMMNHTHEK